jgi:hypothetical protein
MTRGAVCLLVRLAQRIDFRVVGTVKPRWGETVLFMAVEAPWIPLVKLPGVGIFMAPDTGIDPPCVIGRIRVGETLRVGQIAGMTLLTGNVRMRGLQRKAC